MKLPFNTKFDLSKMANNMFKQLENVVLDFQTGNTAIVTDNGLLTYNASTKRVSSNPLSFFTMPIPAFAMRTPLKSLAEGDILVLGNELSYIQGIESDAGTVTALNADGVIRQVQPVEGMMMGQDTVLAVKNLAATGGGSMTQMMPMLLMAQVTSGDGIDIKGLVSMMAMSQMTGEQAGGFGGMAEMMPMLVMAQLVEALQGKTAVVPVKGPGNPAF